MTPDLWEQVELLLPGVERPTRYIDSELGAYRDPDAEYRCVLVYPDTYEVGMANQALQILYARLNGLSGVAAERAFVPWIDMSSAMRAASVPLYGLESMLPVNRADLIGITLPYELTYSNVLETLDLAGVPFRSVDRSDTDPFVIGGGPCAFNPEPVAPFFDAILVGEGEDAIVDIVDAHRAAKADGCDRKETLARLAEIRGVYVPEIHLPDETGRAMPLVTKRVLEHLSDHQAPTCPVVPFMDVVHDRSTVEVLRGCTRGCRFCQAGMVYRPVRERSADEIVRTAIEGLRCTGHDEVSLTSLSTTDHSQLEEVLRRLTSRLEGTGVAVSLPSLRADAFSVDMARLVSGGRKSGLTFAPEAGSQRMRDVINKNVTEDDLLVTIEHAFAGGWRRVKLYFMIGLPTETDEDISAIGDLVRKVLWTAKDATPKDQRGAIRIAVSVSTFVPKAHTPFQWEGQIELAEVQRRQALLRESMPHKGVELSWHDSEVSFLEGVMARGGREVADVIEAAWRAGVRFDAWSEQFDLSKWNQAFSDAGVDPVRIASADRAPGDPLPWSHISAGVSEAYLAGERERAFSAETTPDCSFESCTGCDVCQTLGVDIDLGGERRGAR